MTIAGDLVRCLENRRWQPVVLVGEEYRLEIHPLHAMLEAGFTLWRKRPGEALDLITSGHTYSGNIVGPENAPLKLGDDDRSAMESLLEQNRSRRI